MTIWANMILFNRQLITTLEYALKLIILKNQGDDDTIPSVGSLAQILIIYNSK